MELHDNDKKSLFAEFNLMVESPGTGIYLLKHFNKKLDDQSRRAILEDYPKLSNSPLLAPQIDEEASSQMRCNFRRCYTCTRNR